MKAIRGDNPRTTNQRVYLMPVVSPPPLLPPPERPPDARRGTVFPLFPTPAIRAALSLSVYPSIYLPRAVSLSRFLFLALSPLHPRSVLVALLRSSCRPPSTPPLPLCHPERQFSLPPRHHVVALGYVTMLPT